MMSLSGPLPQSLPEEEATDTMDSVLSLLLGCCFSATAAVLLPLLILLLMLLMLLLLKVVVLLVFVLAGFVDELEPTIETVSLEEESQGLDHRSEEESWSLEEEVDDWMMSSSSSVGSPYMRSFLVAFSIPYTA